MTIEQHEIINLFIQKDFFVLKDLTYALGIDNDKNNPLRSRVHVIIKKLIKNGSHIKVKESTTFYIYKIEQ